MKRVFCIGNGESRQGFDLEKLRPHGKIYGCNAIYRDHPKLCDHIVAVNLPMYEELQQWHNNGKESPTIHGPNDRYINDAKIAEALAQMFSRIGIKAKVETMPKAVYFKRASRGGPNKSPEFSFMVLGWGAGSGEASSPLRALLHTYDKSIGMGRANRGRHSDPVVDKLIQKALGTVDSDARGKLLAEATEVAVGKNYGVIPIHYQMNTWAAKSSCSYTPRTDERTIATYLNCK